MMIRQQWALRRRRLAGCPAEQGWWTGEVSSISDLNKLAASRRPFPKHKTLAEKKSGVRYEECHLIHTCGGGFGECEECWFDSEDYWYDVGPGAPTVAEYTEWRTEQQKKPAGPAQEGRSR